MQDTEYSEDEFEVRHDYPVWVETCASDIYTPSISDLDADSSSTYSRITDQLSVQQANGTTLVSSGLRTLAGAPAYVKPSSSGALYWILTVCRATGLL